MPSRTSLALYLYTVYCESYTIKFVCHQLNEINDRKFLMILIVRGREIFFNAIKFRFQIEINTHVSLVVVSLINNGSGCWVCYYWEICHMFNSMKILYIKALHSYVAVVVVMRPKFYRAHFSLDDLLSHSNIFNATTMNWYEDINFYWTFALPQLLTECAINICHACETWTNRYVYIL